MIEDTENLLKNKMLRLPFFFTLKSPRTLVLQIELSGEMTRNRKYLYLPQVDASYFAVFADDNLIGSVGFSKSRDGHFYYQPFIFELPEEVHVIKIEISGIVDIGIDFVPTIIEENMKSRFILLNALTMPVVYLFLGASLAVSIIMLFIAKNLEKKKKEYTVFAIAGILSYVWIMDTIPLLSSGKFLYLLQRLSIFSMYFIFALVLYSFTKIHFEKIDAIGKVLTYLTMVVSIGLLLIPNHYFLKNMARQFSIIIVADSIYLFLKNLKINSKVINFSSAFFLLNVLHDAIVTLFFLPLKLISVYGAFVFIISYSYSLVFEYRKLLSELSKLHKKSITDPLTGAYTRGALNEIDFQKDDAFIYVDMNGFKRINDLYGHKAGDELLKTFVKIVKMTIRKTDTVFRMGGDEFLIVLRGCPLDRAKEIVEEIRTKFKYSSNFRPDFSYGITNFSNNLLDTISNVDILMYKMKDAVKSNK